jgi:hypothetical protein
MSKLNPVGLRWAHLPNGNLIAEALRDAEHPDTSRKMTALWIAALPITFYAARDAANRAAREATRDFDWNAVWHLGTGATADAIYALVAWDRAALLVTADEPTRNALVALDPAMEHALTLLRPWLTAREGELS